MKIPKIFKKSEEPLMLLPHDWESRLTQEWKSGRVLSGPQSLEKNVREIKRLIEKGIAVVRKPSSKEGVTK